MLRTYLPLAALVFALFSSSILAAGVGEETVTIRNDGDNTYYEFKVDGQLTEIKVVPKHGPAYYLVPTPDNKGELMRKDAPEVRVPSWVIFRW